VTTPPQAPFERFRTFTSPVLPLDRANVDTDAILPKQFMKSIERSGFGEHLFDGWRYEDIGELGMDCSRRPLRADFVLNQPRYANARILLARENFGCGSSREHAVWALRDHGIRVLLAPSFSDIFRGNCWRNGLLPIEMPAAVVTRWLAAAQGPAEFRMTVSLQMLVLQPTGEPPWAFVVDDDRRRALLEGWDEVSITLQSVDDIRGYEQRRRLEEPWVF
jgi:3-isopropylmalate/(R)-2-methylmalate dehydratase small subunit